MGVINHLSQFFNVRTAGDFRQVMGYTAKLLVPERSVVILVVI